jgi:hypothetical protein
MLIIIHIVLPKIRPLVKLRKITNFSNRYENNEKKFSAGFKG